MNKGSEPDTVNAKKPVQPPPEDAPESKLPGVPSHLQAAVRELIEGTANTPAKTPDKDKRK